MLFETEVVACICHSPLHHQKPDFESQSVIKASSYLLFVLEAHRESLPRSYETSARRLSAESAEVYSTADLSADAAHIPFSIPPELLITHVRQRGQGNIHFPCSADHEQDWQPFPVDPYFCYMCDHTYIRATNKYFVLIYYY